MTSAPGDTARPGSGRKAHAGLLGRTAGILEEPLPSHERLRRVCEMLQTAGLSYDWVGYYLVSRDEERALDLGPFAGESTVHVRIGFGQGICGQAADRGVTLVIGDVSAEENYLSCSPSVRSEVVIPVYWEGVLVGELDIDSHRVDGFDDADRAFLEAVADLTSADVAMSGGFRS
jgi:L-methionine (R)-S-oxide reductase